MKKLTRVLQVSALVFLIVSFFSPNIILAGTVHFGQDYSLLKGDEVKEDLYVAGNNTTIAGNVIGDLLAGGLNVFSGGNRVSEDALIIGATVNVLTDVGKDLRIVAGKAYFGGKAGEDLAVISQEIQTLPQSVVGGGALIAGGRVVFGGEILGNAKIVGGDVFINGKIGGSATISANKLVLGPNAQIDGTLTYASSLKAEIDPNAKIKGEIVFKEITDQPTIEKFVPNLWGTWFLIRFVILLISALILHGLFRNISKKFVSTSIQKFWKSLVRGFVFAVAVPIAIVLVFLTFVGMPFGILGMAAYAISLMLAYVYQPIVLGSLAYRLTHMDTGITVNWKTIMLGIVLTIMLSYVPYVGFILKYAMVLVALGGIYEVLFEKFREVR